MGEDILAEPLQPRVWHIPDWLPGDDVAGAFGDGGEGKTALGLQLEYPERWLALKGAFRRFATASSPARRMAER